MRHEGLLVYYAWLIYTFLLSFTFCGQLILILQLIELFGFKHEEAWLLLDVFHHLTLAAATRVISLSLSGKRGGVWLKSTALLH